MNRINWSLYKFQEEQQDENDNDNDDDDFDIVKNNNMSGKLLKFPNELISTPIGDIPSSDGWSPLKGRNIYIANVNFVLTDVHIKLISIVLGIEHVHVISPYSFSVIVGLMFKDEDILDKVEQALDVKSDNEIDTSKYIDDNSPLYDIVAPTLQKLIDNKYWLFYIFPNGKIFEKIYETEEDFNIAIKNFSGEGNNEDFIDYSEGIYFDSKNILN
jgi:hypothetical protein